MNMNTNMTLGAYLAEHARLGDTLVLPNGTHLRASPPRAPRDAGL